MPTASQTVAETQDTEFTVTFGGTVCRRHELPFHCSASSGPPFAELPPPQASQNVSDAQDTVWSWTNVEPGGLGVCCRCQEVPFHAAASVTVRPPIVAVPTASQNRGDVQDTWSRLAEKAPSGTGNRCDAQPCPFHTCAMLTWPKARLYDPTAAQKPAAGQDTPCRSGVTEAAVSSAGLGVCCRCQAVPFHRSARVTVIPTGLRSFPTAVHALADEHETDSSCPPGSVAFAECWILQAGPAAGAALAASAPVTPVTPAMVMNAVSEQAASPAPARVRALGLHLCIGSPMWSYSRRGLGSLSHRVLSRQSPVSMNVCWVWPGLSVTPAAVQAPAAPQDTPLRRFCPAKGWSGGNC